MIVLNAANEIAVEHFLAQKIQFTDIYRVVAGIVEAMEPVLFHTVEEIMEIDRHARKATVNYISELQH